MRTPEEIHRICIAMRHQLGVLYATTREVVEPALLVTDDEWDDVWRWFVAEGKTDDPPTQLVMSGVTLVRKRRVL